MRSYINCTVSVAAGLSCAMGLALGPTDAAGEERPTASRTRPGWLCGRMTGGDQSCRTLRRDRPGSVEGRGGRCSGIVAGGPTCSGGNGVASAAEGVDRRRGGSALHFAPDRVSGCDGVAEGGVRRRGDSPRRFAPNKSTEFVRSDGWMRWRTALECETRSCWPPRPSRGSRCRAIAGSGGAQVRPIAMSEEG